MTSKNSAMDEIIQACKIKLQNATKSGDTKKAELYNTIYKIIKAPGGLASLDVEMSLNILSDLGFTKDQAINLLKTII